MAFWKKDTGRSILREFDNLKKALKNLRSGPGKIEKSKIVIELIRRFSKDLKEEVLQLAEENKSRPWIDARYDHAIDRLAQQEVAEIDKFLEQVEEYSEMLTGLHSDDIDDLMTMMLEEESEIEKRQKRNDEQIQAMVKETLNERLKAPSSSLPNNKTKDGIPWSNISAVIRRLGGVFQFVKGTRHPYKIDFPNHTSLIPLSEDVQSGKLAKQVREQLQHSLPEYKWIKSGNLRRAFNTGDVFQAA